MKTSSSRSDLLASESVGRLLLRLSVPAVVGMLVQALYNAVDTVFVGQAVGTLGIGGLSVVFPIQMLLMAVAQTFGVGGASRISRCMGAGDVRGAGFTFGNMVLLAVLAGFLFLVAGLVFPVALLRAFGATDALLPSALEYFGVIIYSSPLMAFVMATNNAVRAEGNATVAMRSMMLGAGLNIALDPVFIFLLDMGVRGAAVATVISLAVSCVYLGGYFILGKSELPMGWRYFRFQRDIAVQVVSVGSSTFARTGATSVTTLLLNHILGGIAGEIGIATFGVMFRLLMFLFMPLTGISQGLQPIVGYNYGARQFHRVRQGVRIAVFSGTVVASLAFILFFGFPGMLMRLFTDDPQLVASGRNALRWSLICLPLAGFQIVGSGVFQALGKSVPALFLSLSRPLLLLFPFVMILPRFFGVNGVWFSFPLSDGLSFLITFVMVRRVLGRLAPLHCLGATHGR